MVASLPIIHTATFETRTIVSIARAIGTRTRSLGARCWRFSVASFSLRTSLLASAYSQPLFSVTARARIRYVAAPRWHCIVAPTVLLFTAACLVSSTTCKILMSRLSVSLILGLSVSLLALLHLVTWSAILRLGRRRLVSSAARYLVTLSRMWSCPTLRARAYDSGSWLSLSSPFFSSFSLSASLAVLFASLSPYFPFTHIMSRFLARQFFSSFFPSIRLTPYKQSYSPLMY